MRLSSLQWAVIGLIVIIAIAYALNRGVYIGATIDASAREGPGSTLYSKSCRYLHFDGVHGTVGTETHSREDAESASCAPVEGLN